MRCLSAARQEATTIPTRMSSSGRLVIGMKRFATLSRQAKRDLDASRAALSVMKVGARVAREIDRALAGAELTLPQFNVLMEIAASDAGMMPMHEVNARLVTTPPNLSWLTGRMRDADLITKERDRDDARVVQLAITETGWKALEQAMPLAFEVERRLLSKYSKAELRHITTLLEPLMH